MSVSSGCTGPITDRHGVVSVFVLRPSSLGVTDQVSGHEGDDRVLRGVRGGGLALDPETPSGAPSDVVDPQAEFVSVPTSFAGGVTSEVSSSHLVVTRCSAAFHLGQARIDRPSSPRPNVRRCCRRATPGCPENASHGVAGLCIWGARRDLLEMGRVIPSPVGDHPGRACAPASSTDRVPCQNSMWGLCQGFSGWARWLVSTC
jgi:hypothetical protein